MQIRRRVKETGDGSLLREEGVMAISRVRKNE